MRALKGAVLLAGILAACPCQDPAAAQSAGAIYTGQLDIYSLAIPSGWTEVDGGGNVDAAFAPPGGTAYGSIFVGVMYAKRSLEEEADNMAGNEATQGRRHLSVGGMPCIYFAATGSRGERNNNLACQFMAPLGGGAELVTFFMGSASRPQDFAWQSDVFWQVVDSISWANGTVAGSDPQDTGDNVDDGEVEDIQDAPGTWVLYVSPPGTADADPRPRYDEWVAFRQYQGLANCLAARLPAHLEYWDSDRDLSVRALNGICFNPDTREIRGEH
jgi:hypothetical protein